jgi:hypothetical protein
MSYLKEQERIAVETAKTLLEKVKKTNERKNKSNMLLKYS